MLGKYDITTVFYCTYIIKGWFVFDTTPEMFKNQVAKALIKEGHEDLIGDYKVDEEEPTHGI